VTKLHAALQLPISLQEQRSSIEFV